MPSGSTDRREKNGSVLRHFSTWSGAVVRLGRAHLQLLGREGKDAALHFGIIAAVAVGALLCLLFGYAFLCLTIVFGIAAWIGQSWLWAILGGMALLHVVLAGAAAWFVWSRIKKPVFAQTVEELRKDHLWLTTKADAR